MKKYPIDLTRVLRVRGIGRSDDETVRDFFESIGVEITKVCVCIYVYSCVSMWVCMYVHTL